MCGTAARTTSSLQRRTTRWQTTPYWPRQIQRCLIRQTQRRYTILPHTACSGSAPLVNGSTQRLMSAQTGVEVQQYEGVHLEPVQEDLNEHEASSVETAKKV